MQGNQVGFESSFQQHLDTEQRRAVLEAIGASINPDSTLGEILDAAEALGWSEKMGDLSLADLAEALLAPEGDAAAAGLGSAGKDTEALAAEGDEDEDEDEDEDDDLDDEELDEDEDEEDLDDEEEDDDEQLELEVAQPVASRRKAGKTKVVAKGRAAAARETKVAKKKVAAKKGPAKKAVSARKAAAERHARLPEKTSKKAGKAAPAPSPSKKAAKKAAPVVEKAPPPSSKKSGKRKLTAVDVDDRMSLDQAAEFFMPYVEELGEATMQALEENTGVSRRKLRFHVGQLVKHGYLERHGMGRGTYYTKV